LITQIGSLELFTHEQEVIGQSAALHEDGWRKIN
jgi:hypothetical protein